MSLHCTLLFTWEFHTLWLGVFDKFIDWEVDNYWNVLHFLLRQRLWNNLCKSTPHVMTQLLNCIVFGDSKACNPQHTSLGYSLFLLVRVGGSHCDMKLSFGENVLKKYGGFLWDPCSRSCLGFESPHCIACFFHLKKKAVKCFFSSKPCNIHVGWLRSSPVD